MASASAAAAAEGEGQGGGILGEVRGDGPEAAAEAAAEAFRARLGEQGRMRREMKAGLQVRL